MPARVSLPCLAMLVACVCAGQNTASAQARDVLDARSAIDAPHWQLFAVEYARSRNLPEWRLVRGAPSGARVDMSWYFFAALGHGRAVLIDVGTDVLAYRSREELRSHWSIERAVTVPEALARIGLTPDDVTDVVLTHYHFDHSGGLAHFPGATVHANAAEWERVPARLRGRFRGERLDLLSESPAELWGGLAVREAGRHTAHHLMVEVACATGPVVIAGDAAYLYRNIEEGLPVSITVSRSANTADVARVAEEFGPANVIPGHDPALFDRYPAGVEGVAAICR